MKKRLDKKSKLTSIVQCNWVLLTFRNPPLIQTMSPCLTVEMSYLCWNLLFALWHRGTEVQLHFVLKAHTQTCCFFKGRFAVHLIFSFFCVCVQINHTCPVNVLTDTLRSSTLCVVSHSFLLGPTLGFFCWNGTFLKLAAILIVFHLWLNVWCRIRSELAVTNTLLMYAGTLNSPSFLVFIYNINSNHKCI